MDRDRLHKQIDRMNELFKPIEQQIFMTDDKQDLLLLATVMFTTARKIFLEEYSEEEAKHLMKIIIGV